MVGDNDGHYPLSPIHLYNHWKLIFGCVIYRHPFTIMGGHEQGNSTVITMGASLWRVWRCRFSLSAMRYFTTNIMKMVATLSETRHRWPY